MRKKLTCLWWTKLNWAGCTRNTQVKYHHLLKIRSEGMFKVIVFAFGQWVLDSYHPFVAASCFKHETLLEYAAYLIPELQLQYPAGKCLALYSVGCIHYTTHRGLAVSSSSLSRSMLPTNTPIANTLFSRLHVIFVSQTSIYHQLPQ